MTPFKACSFSYGVHCQENTPLRVRSMAAGVARDHQGDPLRILRGTCEQEHALRLFDLPTHHADPFDRRIIAQALVENVPVVTPDEAFRLYDGLKVVW